MKINRWTWVLTILMTLFFWGCTDNEPNEGVQRETTPPAPHTVARFNPSSGNPADLPIPNDILRSRTTGLNAIPGGATNPAIAALNTLAGFSTSAPIFIPFGGTVNASSVNSHTILVVNLATYAPQAMKFQVLTNPTTHDSTVVATPMKPLMPGVPHIVIVTPGVLGQDDGLSVTSDVLMTLLKSSNSFLTADGHTTVAAFSDAQATSLEPLRVAYQTIWGGAEQITQLSRYDLAMAFAFTTQPLFATLPALRAQAQNLNPTPTILQAFPTPAAVDGFFNIAGLGSAPHAAIGSLYYGSFDAPNFQGAGGIFAYSEGQLQQAGTNSITFWAVIPATAQGPVPVMIFQHGLGRSKEDMFAIANTAASFGVGMIGIDIVKHGDRSLRGADGTPYPSGTGFIDLLSPLTTRDNARQTVADLFVLTRMLTSAATDFNGDSVPEFAPVGLTYIGQSLGALTGGTFAGLEPNISLACLNVPGGRVGSLLPNSYSISQSINPALQAAAGIVPGTPEYMLFWMIFQTVIDDADPFNYAPHFTSGGLAGGVGTTVLVQEMQNDLVVPNSATEDLVRAMGLPQVAAQWEYAGQTQEDAPYLGSGHFQYIDGAHGFLLDPSQGPTVAGQTQAMTFLLGGLQGNPVIIDPFAGAAKATVTPYLISTKFQFEQTFNFDPLFFFAP